MNDQQRRRELLHAYHDDELGPLGRWRVRRLLARDPASREELARLGTLGDLLRESEASAETPDLWPGIVAQLPHRDGVALPATGGAEGGMAPWLRWVPAGVAAAALAVVLAVGLGEGDASDARSLRWLDAGSRSASVLQDDQEATIIWIMDAKGEQTSRGRDRALI
ncbi:MAG: hypothetical protein CL910_12925 [Deltaproteobacteria bacterium]|jgi:anti-sigma factor RsiW|nr:hypothetical protein [Deltaproteobacteria bacterium]